MFNISIAQISIWTWSNALYNSRRNQINIAQITILQLLFTNQIKSNVGFWWGGKPEFPWKNLSWQSTGPTNSIHIWHRVRKSNPGHIGGRQVLSPLAQPKEPNYNQIGGVAVGSRLGPNYACLLVCHRKEETFDHWVHRSQTRPVKAIHWRYYRGFFSGSRDAIELRICNLREWLSSKR